MSDTLGIWDRSKLTGNPSDQVGLGVFDELSVGPESKDFLQFACSVHRRKIRSNVMLCILDDFLPCGHIDSSTSAFGHIIPVHVLATFVHNPDELL